MRMEIADSIHLKGGADYITSQPDDAFHVISGQVLVYIVPWRNGNAGRRSFLCEVSAGKMIPAFSYRDMEYRSWRFCLSAIEEAEIERLPKACTEPLRRKFLSCADIERQQHAKYEDALVERYRMNLTKEDGYFVRMEQEREKTENGLFRMILSVFQKERTIPSTRKESPLYQAAEALCEKAGISITPYERIKTHLGREPTLQDIARLSHFPIRKISLEEHWEKTDAGLILAFRGEEREPVACVPKGQTGYVFRQRGKKDVRVTKEIAKECHSDAFMIYRPFPQKSVMKGDLARYCLQCLNRADIACILLLTVISSLMGLLIPTLTQKLYDTYIPLGAENVMIQFGGLIAVFMLGNIAFSVVKGLSAFRMRSHIRYQAQSAMYYRIFELPESFLRKYESADLARRVMEVGELAGEIGELCLSLALTLVMMCFYLVRMFSYSAELSAICLFFTLTLAVISFFIARRQISSQSKLIELDTQSASILYQFIQGIEKVRMAGIETQALYEYMNPHVAMRKLSTAMSRLSNLRSVILSLGNGALMVTLYAFAYQSASLTVGQFAAFVSAFGMVSQTIDSLLGGLLSFEQIKPAYERIRILLETAPENSGQGFFPQKLTGRIDMNHVSFSYDENASSVFSDFSIHIQPGEYVGIVGASGCGKSTLIRLLLGFERPAAGKIYYDSQDISELDLRELRKQFGVVLQDGDLISGSIYDNIAITSPFSDYRDVQAAAEAVGLWEDIREMPMGLATIVNEHCATLSGGQKQRILIARAILNRPKILILDEATSALDNLTQSVIGDTLKRMDCTRIVVAHRLSTIRDCDRIIVLSEGNIAEEGDFLSLMAQKGLFYELASRQMI